MEEDTHTDQHIPTDADIDIKFILFKLCKELYKKLCKKF